ncbi:RHS domain-containing protein [Burkholderia aenigmatica]|nr:RHS repeat-associated core domain-containing protein [Burkholderia aenigmatica]UKD13716.1 RHS domain-containing protein [Burkholderia aenigmatica]
MAIDTARIYHFHTDLVGALLEVTDEFGELAWAGKYMAWRKVAPSARQLTADRPLRYAGQYADDSTGPHYNTFRFYDPDVGRFINQDPIGLLGGSNLYQYAPNPLPWMILGGGLVPLRNQRNSTNEPSLKLQRCGNPLKGSAERVRNS